MQEGEMKISTKYRRLPALPAPRNDITPALNSNLLRLLHLALARLRRFRNLRNLDVWEIVLTDRVNGKRI